MSNSRIRTIKPEFFKHEALFDLEKETGLPLRVAFPGLWTQCDRAGRFAWRPRQLKTDILPYDDVDFSRVLDALATRGFVVKYVVDGEAFGYIPSWNKHQVINNREKASDLPQPTDDNIVSDACATREPRVPDAIRKLPSGREGKGREQEGKEDNPNFNSGTNGPSKYAFAHGCVKLNQRDLEKWQRAFPHVSVEGELYAKEPWLAKQSNWFNAAAGWLAKAERQAKSRGPPDDHEPPIRDPSEGF